MSNPKDSIRNSILGADRAFRVVDGGRDGAGPPGPVPPRREGSDDPCPVIALGDNDGAYYFLDVIGQRRVFTARELGNRQAIMSLFRGTDEWLERNFPVVREIQTKDEATGEAVKRKVTVDFSVNRAARWLIGECSRQGLFGSRTKLRRGGVWRGDDGMPVVHCGDAVLIGDQWYPPGTRTGSQLWVAQEATPRPGSPCDYRVAQRLQEDLQRCWNFRNPGSAVALIGLLYSCLMCGALEWRCNGFVTGGSGTGKSALRRVLRAALPVHDYSNDTSKAGMEQTVSGMAIPAIIDEANDRNHSSGRDLIDIILSASGDEGTVLARGTADGKGRSSEVVSAVIMFSINPPELEPQHLNRFTMIELQAADQGADFTAEHRRIADEVKKASHGLWGRAVSSWERYVASLAMFRDALRQYGCDPRTMDGQGAVLAGWFVLTHEGLPEPLHVREGIGALGDLVVVGNAAKADDGPRRCIDHLLACQIEMHRSSERESVGTLLDYAYGLDPEIHHPSSAAKHLERYGIRPVRACKQDPAKVRQMPCRCQHCWDDRLRRPVPRIGLADGLYISNTNPAIASLYRGTSFEAGRWRHEIMRLPSARSSGKAVRIGGVTTYGIWLDREALHPLEDETLSAA